MLGGTQSSGSARHDSMNWILGTEYSVLEVGALGRGQFTPSQTLVDAR
jgi:hypothetical protein